MDWCQRRCQRDYKIDNYFHGSFKEFNSVGCCKQVTYLAEVRSRHGGSEPWDNALGHRNLDLGELVHDSLAGGVTERLKIEEQKRNRKGGVTASNEKTKQRLDGKTGEALERRCSEHGNCHRHGRKHMETTILCRKGKTYDLVRRDPRLPSLTSTRRSAAQSACGHRQASLLLGGLASKGLHNLTRRHCHRGSSLGESCRFC